MFWWWWEGVSGKRKAVKEAEEACTEDMSATGERSSDLYVKSEGEMGSTNGGGVQRVYSQAKNPQDDVLRASRRSQGTMMRQKADKINIT